MSAPPLPITSRLVRDIYNRLCDNADAYHEACDVIARESGPSCEETTRLIRDRYARDLAQLTAPLTIDLQAMPLLQGTALTVPKATDLRQRHAETWNATLLARIADWDRKYPTTCGQKFHNVLRAFATTDDAAFWLQNREQKRWIEDLGNGKLRTE